MATSIIAFPLIGRIALDKAGLHLHVSWVDRARLGSKNLHYNKDLSGFHAGRPILEQAHTLVLLWQGLLVTTYNHKSGYTALQRRGCQLPYRRQQNYISPEFLLLCHCLYLFHSRCHEAATSSPVVPTHLSASSTGSPSISNLQAQP